MHSLLPLPIKDLATATTHTVICPVLGFTGRIARADVFIAATSITDAGSGASFDMVLQVGAAGLEETVATLSLTGANLAGTNLEKTMTLVAQDDALNVTDTSRLTVAITVAGDQSDVVTGAVCIVSLVEAKNP